MLRFEVLVEDLLRSRFALSPAMDLCLLLRSLAGQNRPLPRAWATRLLPAFERLRRETELDAALALHTPQSGPNFVAPPPRGLNQTWADDLAMIRATPLEAARHEFATTATGSYVHDPAYAQCWTPRTPSPGSPRRWTRRGTSCSPRTGRNCARSVSAMSCTGWV